MKILEYNDVDPLKVMYINQLALDFALTPELAAHIRQSDPRPFPCLAVYAVEDDAVLGRIDIGSLITCIARMDIWKQMFGLQRWRAGKQRTSPPVCAPGL